MRLSVSILATLVLVYSIDGISGHARLDEPVNRSSAWRKGFNTTKNYNDYEENCGGYANHYQKNGGKCGVCGDDYSLPRPRPNENGGIYGSGVIVKTYKSGETIRTVTDVMANHVGYYEFHLCPLSHPKELEEEECFMKYPLKFADGSDRFYLTNYNSGYYENEVVLPAGVKCDSCVLRWNWVTGNRWGICEDGKGGMGCGEQEVFRTCSDIKIE